MAISQAPLLPAQLKPKPPVVATQFSDVVTPHPTSIAFASAEFHDIAPGAYSVCAAADRDVTFGCAPVTIAAGDSVREVTLTLTPVAKPDATR